MINFFVVVCISDSMHLKIQRWRDKYIGLACDKLVFRTSQCCSFSLLSSAITILNIHLKQIQVKADIILQMVYTGVFFFTLILK